MNPHHKAWANAIAAQSEAKAIELVGDLEREAYERGVADERRRWASTLRSEMEQLGERLVMTARDVIADAASAWGAETDEDGNANRIDGRTA